MELLFRFQGKLKGHHLPGGAPDFEKHASFWFTKRPVRRPSSSRLRCVVSRRVWPSGPCALRCPCLVCPACCGGGLLWALSAPGSLCPLGGRPCLLLPWGVGGLPASFLPPPSCAHARPRGLCGLGLSVLHARPRPLAALGLSSWAPPPLSLSLFGFFGFFLVFAVVQSPSFRRRQAEDAVSFSLSTTELTFSPKWPGVTFFDPKVPGSPVALFFPHARYPKNRSQQ